MDWNSLLCEDPRLRFTRYTESYFPAADDLLHYLHDFAEAAQLKIQYNARVCEITRNGCFRAIDEDGRQYEAERLIVASGVSKPYIPPIPGIETAECYNTVSVEPRDFLDQRVLIVGKGNYTCKASAAADQAGGF
jgi:cation diffusion facilitator CzcD-associated flavoprotein CzcO